jgi:hypothetical protein
VRQDLLAKQGARMRRTSLAPVQDLFELSTSRASPFSNRKVIR